jgi:hypothetical protein
MLHRFAGLRENLWSLSQPGLHPVEHELRMQRGQLISTPRFSA